MKQNMKWLLMCVVLLNSCNDKSGNKIGLPIFVDPVVETKKEIDTRFLPEFNNDITFIISSMHFYRYCVVTNYWYRSGTTVSDVIDENFEHGISGLKKLRVQLSQIQSTDERLNSRIASLKKESKTVQKNVEGLQGEFAMAKMYSGGQLMALNMLVGSANFTDRYTKVMFAKFAKVESRLDELYNDMIPTHLLDFEIKMTGNKSLKAAQKEEIRTYIDQKMRKRLAELTPTDLKETLNYTIAEIYRNRNRIETELSAKSKPITGTKE